VPTHVSVRLYWHDNGWDGAICRDPAANTWCEAHDHVRDHKSADESNENVRGKPVLEAGVPPGCEVSIQAFSRRRNEIRVWPPDWMTASGVNPVDLELDGVTTGMWPYEEMWTEDGGFKNNDERRAIAERFFEQAQANSPRGSRGAEAAPALGGARRGSLRAGPSAHTYPPVG
jgi:hypothetical protein